MCYSSMKWWCLDSCRCPHRTELCRKEQTSCHRTDTCHRCRFLWSLQAPPDHDMLWICLILGHCTGFQWLIYSHQCKEEHHLLLSLISNCKKAQKHLHLSFKDICETEKEAGKFIATERYWINSDGACSLTSVYKWKNSSSRSARQSPCCFLALNLILMRGLISQLDFGPASSLQSCVVIWTLRWTWLQPIGMHCLPSVDTVAWALAGESMVVQTVLPC